jgi:predicted dithiol-disulfide oxidoreductase (DUF899 family)
LTTINPEEEDEAMTEHQVATREGWLEARKELLEQEKEHTRRSDELARRRRELPWVPIEEDYRFETDAGTQSLAELFDGRSQLIVYHFMLGPNTPDGCPGCTFAADNFSGAFFHLATSDVTFVCASRASLDEIHAYKERMGWTFPWVSSGGTDFNRDFTAFTEEERRNGTGFNFGTPRHADLDLVDGEELMALSCFALEDGVVYHTYSCYDRGTDVINPTWQLLDRAPRGRELPADWPRRRDESEWAAA